MSSPDDCDRAIPDQAAKGRDRTATGLLIAVGLAVAAAMVPLLIASANDTLQAALHAAGLGRGIDAEQRQQAAAISRLEQALGTVIGEVAAINARGEGAARDDRALRERLAKLDADMADMRANLSPQRVEAEGGEPWRGQVLALNVSLARSGIEIDALRASIDTQEREERTALRAVAGRVERLEALLAHEATGSVRPASVKARPKHRRLPRPAALPGWSVAHAQDGFAIVAGRDGTFDARPGHVIPGLGRVTEVRRTAASWIVVTEKGTIVPR